MSTLLFDLFGVIAKEQSERGIAELERLAEVPSSRLWPAFWGLRQPYDRGDVTGRQYWRSVGSSVGREFTEERIDELVDADVRSWSEVDQEMVDFVGSLAAAGRRVGLLSNIPVEHAERFERRHGWLDVFGVRAFSCRIGHAKPEPGAYGWCLDAFGVPASEVLFIDDREANVSGARAVGMRAHHFTSLATLRPVLDLAAGQS